MRYLIQTGAYKISRGAYGTPTGGHFNVHSLNIFENCTGAGVNQTNASETRNTLWKQGGISRVVRRYYLIDSAANANAGANETAEKHRAAWLSGGLRGH